MTDKEISALMRSLSGKKRALGELRRYIRDEREKITGLRAVDYETLKVAQSGGNGSEEHVIRYLSAVERIWQSYDRIFEEMCREEERLAGMMKSLSPTETEVILNRYVRGLTVRETAKKMNYAEEYVHVLCNRAFKKMATNAN